MRGRTVQPMTEGGILAAISAAMALIGVYVPLVGTFAALLWPLPIILLVVRRGVRWGILAMVVSGLLISLLFHPLQAIMMVAAFGLVGLTIGFAYRKGYGATRTLLLATFVSVVSKVLVIGGSILIMQINPLQFQADAMQEAFDYSVEQYRSAGFSEQQIQESTQNFQNSMKMAQMLFPPAIVFAGMFDAYLNVVISGKVLQRIGWGKIAPLLPFSAWRFPWGVVYLYAFSLIGMYWGETRQIGWLTQVSLNVNLFSGMLGFVQGASILNCAANRYNLSKWLRGIILVLALLNGFLLQTISLIGLFDIIFDYRRRLGIGG